VHETIPHSANSGNSQLPTCWTRHFFPQSHLHSFTTAELETRPSSSLHHFFLLLPQILRLFLAEPVPLTAVAMASTAKQQQVGQNTITVMVSIAICFCIITGAMSYIEWPKEESTALQVLGAIIGFIYFWIVALTLTSCDNGAAMFSAGILSASITTAYCIISTGWRNFFHPLFWIMISGSAACVLEWATGFFSSIAAIISRQRTRRDSSG
jgi:hypothetical protein